MLKFKAEKCECGLDLTAANPMDEIFTKGEEGKELAWGVCPNCRRTLPMVYVEDKPEPAASEPEPEAEPEPESEPEPAETETEPE